MKFRLGVLALAMLGVVAPAEASQVSFFGLGIYSNPIGRGFVGGDPYRGRLSFGAGALVEFSVAPWLGVETGALYFQRKFNDAGANYSGPVIRIPVAMRIWLGLHWSIAGGVYVSTAAGALRRPTGGEISYDHYGWRSTELGGLGSLRYDFGGVAFSGFFVEGRYNFGWTNVAIPRANTETYQRDLECLIGVRFGG